MLLHVDVENIKLVQTMEFTDGNFCSLTIATIFLDGLRGGDLGDSGGRSPPKFEAGTSPNILRKYFISS